jgi:hypothetical protein
MIKRFFKRLESEFDRFLKIEDNDAEIDYILVDYKK